MTNTDEKAAAFLAEGFVESLGELRDTPLGAAAMERVTVHA